MSAASKKLIDEYRKSRLKASFDPTDFGSLLSSHAHGSRIPTPPSVAAVSLGAAEGAAQHLQEAAAAKAQDTQHLTPFYIPAAQKLHLNNEGDSVVVIKERKKELQELMEKVDDDDDAMMAVGAKLNRIRELKKKLQNEYDIKLGELQDEYTWKLREIEGRYQTLIKKVEGGTIGLEKMARRNSSTRGGKKRKTKKHKSKKHKSKKHKTKKYKSKKTKHKTKRR